MAPAKTQNANAKPIGPNKRPPVWRLQTTDPNVMESMRAPKNGLADLLSLAFLHGIIAPIGKIMASATIKGVKARSKN